MERRYSLKTFDMTTASNDLENEIESWLKIVLKDENLQDFSVSIIGSSEKGDGYMGDIVFASVSGINNSGPQNYDLVLKCSQRSKALRKVSPVKETFLNEIQIYEKILPYFTKFQKEKGIREPFNNFPKCFGSLMTQDMEILVLQNLKSVGYELWPKKQPLSRKHIDYIVTQYGKLHATSVAVEMEEPETIQQLAAPLSNIMRLFAKSTDLQTLFGNPIDESCELLQNVVEEDILEKWQGFKDQIDFIANDMEKSVTGMKVILHGDCWNNNFMHLHEDGLEKIPSKVAFLDWQLAKYASPIIDLAYFIFSCISEEDLLQLDDVLRTYHDSFLRHLGLLGVQKPDVVYPFGQFLNEWKSYSRYGILCANLLIKIASTDKDEAADMAQFAENGEDIGHSFMYEIKDKETYRTRMRPIVECVVKNGLI